MVKTHNDYVYMLTNWTNSVLYIGVTSDLPRRRAEHRPASRKNTISPNWSISNMRPT